MQDEVNKQGVNGRYRAALRWALFVGCVLIWQWVTWAARNPYFPTPLTIARRAGRLWFAGPPGHLLLTDGVFDDVAPSIGRIAVGWGAAVVVGVVVGLVLGRAPVAADYCRGLLAFARAVPPSTLVPVLLVLFHVGATMEIVAIFFGSVWPVLLDAVDGARSVHPVTMDTALVFRIPWYRRAFGIVAPAAAPKILGGLRISLSIAFILMVVAELFGGTSGIGHRLALAERAGDLPGMWAWIVLIGVLAYAGAGLVGIVERGVLGRLGDSATHLSPHS